MPLTPADIIPEAIGLAYPYVSEFATARGPLLRRLFALDSKVANLYTHTAPERITVVATPLTVSLATNATGYALVAARSYINFKWIDVTGTEVPITSYSSMTPNELTHPAIIVRGTTLFPFDPAGSSWLGNDTRPYFLGNGDTIGYDYIAEPTPVTTMAQVLVSPVEARHYLTVELVLQILQVSGAPPQRMQEVARERDEVWSSLQLLATRKTDVR